MLRLAVIFNKGLGVCLVCKSFLAHRDAFLFGPGPAWGIEVPDVELSHPQSEVCASLQELEKAGTHGTMNGGMMDNGGFRTQLGQGMEDDN